MQYVRSISGSVSKTWNSINPATLSGAIDVIVIEQEDGKATRRYQLLDNQTDRPRSRNPRLLALPRPLWQILPPAAVREKSGIQSQWGQARLCDETGRRRRGLLCLRDH